MANFVGANGVAEHIRRRRKLRTYCEEGGPRLSIRLQQSRPQVLWGPMDWFEVPPTHIAYCVENLRNFVSVSPQEIVRRAPSLPFSATIQNFIDEQMPFVLVVGEKQRAHFQHAFAEPTPCGNDKDDRPRPHAYSLLQIVLAKSVGEPFSQVADCADAIVQDVFPAEDQVETPDTSTGSQKPFGFHTDKSCSPDQSPDWVTLACIRNTERGTTSVSPIRNVVDKLSTYHRHNLEGPNFRFGSDVTNIGPIFTRDKHLIRNVRLSTHMTPLTSAAELAYRRLLRGARDVADPVALESGQILFLPNKTCVHGRHGFMPHREPDQRRFLQRVYMRK